MFRRNLFSAHFSGNRAPLAANAIVADQCYNPRDLLRRVLLKNHKLDRNPLV